MLKPGRLLGGLSLFILIFLSVTQARGQCTAAITGNRVICLGDTAHFHSVMTAGGLVSNWNFGDGGTDTGLVVSHVYADTGLYILSHGVQIAACFQTLFDTIRVVTPPQLSFTWENDCADDGVHFYASVQSHRLDTAGIPFWESGAGDTLSGDSILFLYPSSGYYTVGMISNGLGCSSEIDSPIYVAQKPEADFSFSGNTCAGDSMTFTYTGSAYKPVLSWSFGDVFSGTKNTDSVASPKHRFTGAGSYSVRLIVTDSLDCKDTVIKTIQILQTAIAGFDFTNVCAGASTNFSQSNSLDMQDTLLSYFWDFGDGDTSHNLSPAHTYADTGLYTVRLIISTTGNCVDTVDRALHIHPFPLISLNKDSACAGTSVNFQHTNPYSEITGYLWNFGDGFTSTSVTPAHQYSTAGNFYARLRLTYVEGKTCFSGYDSVLINALPSAGFVIDNDTQCFKGNQVCVHILNQSPNTKTRRVLFDDGYVEVDHGPTDTFVCYSYSDAIGGSYFIAVQMLDSNGCSQSLSADTAVVIHPVFDTDFSQNVDAGCFQTEVTFSNESNQNPPEVESFRWSFGDGAVDSGNWSSPSHIYTSNGSYNVTLWAVNDKGCVDSTVGSSSIVNTSYPVDAQIDSIPSGCASNNRVYAHQTPVAGASIIWVWGNFDTTNSFSTAYHFNSPGYYVPRVTISLNGCDTSLTFDTIAISGPVAAMSYITNQYQCQVDDTVYVGNGSNYFLNTQRGAFWNFGDFYASSCTSNYEAGINATGNCRYTTDSVDAKHMYDRNQEGCYYISLLAYDSVSGCSDTVSTHVALMPPVAGPDTALFVTGLNVLDSRFCLGPESDKVINIGLAGTQPYCARQFHWLMWDSACAQASGNFNSHWVPGSTSNQYDYGDAACDPNGFVTLGLIIQNGTDSLGNVCRDTAWYHHIMQFDNMNPDFESSYDAGTYYCPGSTFDFYLTDTAQDSVFRVRWDWGDGSVTDTLSTDTVQHTYAQAGNYTVINYIETYDGCTGNDTFVLFVGLNANIGFSQTQLCVGDSVQILPQILYFSDPYAYWNDPSRAAAGKEAVFFDLGDGNGFQDIGGSPWIMADAVKDFTLQMAFRDSLGCWDTLNYNDSVRIYGAFAEFSTQLDTFLCPQAIAFTNLSSVFDSTAGMAQAGDSLVSFEWEFDSLLAPSFLQHPERFLAIGDYTVWLKVTNIIGCQDSVSHPLTILGPVARYSLISDSSGCSPLRVSFQNESSFANNYVWQFNDSANTVLSTSSDTDFYFDYPQYGNYVAVLSAQGSFDQNGIPITCSAVFPDSTAWDSLRLISVFETPVADYSFVTDCANKSSTFQNLTHQQTDTTFTYLWEFGDGDTSSLENPTHFYADTGHYTVILHSYSGLGCEDTAVKEVVIAPNPVAWFSHNEVCLGTTTVFQDSTEAFNDQIYDWQWDFGDGNTSIQENPAHLFGTDSTYDVQLLVTNIAGCTDSVTRSVRIHSFPDAGFTAGNECRYDSVAMVESSNSSELPLDFNWDFGDGNQSVQASPSHLYTGSGVYLITLRVETPWGCADSAEQFVTIYQEPSAAFDINDTSQCLLSQDFAFVNTGTDGTGTTTISWDFGDSQNDAGSSVNHLYAAAGSYQVRQVLLSSFSCSDTSYATVHVSPSARSGFFINDASQCRNENAFIFTDTSTINTGIISRTWFAGDGTSSIDSIFNHTYADTGVYEVLLVLLSDQGCEDTVRQFVRVNPSPISEFVIDDSTQCLSGNVFNLTNTSSLSEGNMDFVWNFGDGTSSTMQSLLHSYPIDSVWTVTLIVSSDSLCRDTFSRGIETYTMPEAAFSMNDSGQCLAGNNFLFSNESAIDTGSLNYAWYFNDDDSSNSASPGHTYLVDGNYAVVLFARSNMGCVDSAEKALVVYPMPVSHIGASDSLACFRDHSFVLRDSTSMSSGNWTRIWNFGDGNQDTASQVNHSYAGDGNYTVWLRVESDFGCADSISRVYTVHPQAEANFIVNDSTQCFRDHLFVFTNASNLNSGALSYTWDFGDGNSDTATNPVYDYSVYGDYTVRLISNTPFNCSDSIEQLIVAYPQPQSHIGLADSMLCFRDHVFNFVDSSSLGYGAWSRVWRFGDGLEDTALQVNHSYSIDGDYTTWLRVESEFGCTDSVSRQYTVHPQALSGFAVNDSSQCFRDHLFSFTNTSSSNGGSLSYAWDFGDGNTDTSEDPAHSYAAYGDYTVRVISNTPFSCADTVSKEMVVYPMPQSRIGIADSALCYRDHAFVMHDSGSIAAGSWSRLWRLGDLQEDTNAQVVKTYAGHGSFTVWLRLESDFGCTDSVSRVYTVYPQADADFSIDDSLQCFRAHQFKFSNLSSVSGGGLSYRWNFGDGNTDNTLSPSHIYNVFGDYPVELIANTVFGCADTLEKDLRVDPSPEARIWLNDSGQCINAQSFLFRDSTTLQEGTHTVLWRFGDGNTSILEDPLHTYAVTGNLTAELIVTSDKACSDSIEVPLEVFPKPSPTFVINDSGQCVNTNTFAFTNGSTIEYGTLTYNWSYGDGATSNDQNPVYVYSYPDTFRVVLEAVSNELCTDSFFRTVVAFPKPMASWVINDTAQCVNTNDFQFQATVNISSGNLQHYFWDLENSLDTGDLDTARTYASAGNNAVWFFAQSELDCWDTLSNIVTVHPKPHALFSLNDSDQCVNTQDFIFTNSSTISAGTLSYVWDFGDGDGATDFQPVKTYLAHDSVVVILFAESDLGCFDTTSHELIILPKPTVDFTINDSDQCVNGNFFAFSSTSVIDYGTLFHAWDLGNTETAVMPDTSVVYANHNTYAVKLKVTSNVGCNDSLEKQVIVYPKPNPAFDVNDFGQCINTQDFQFTDQANIAYGNLHYTWRFGDLTEDTSSNPSHHYSTYGIFTVRQVVHSDYGCRDSVEHPVQVLAKPQAAFTINDSTQCVNRQDFRFASNSSIPEGSLQQVYWDFDEGNTASGSLVNHYFVNPGTYEVELIAESDSLCYDTLYRNLRVFPKPIAAFGYNDSAQCHRGNLYAMHSLSFDSSGIQRWSWTIDVDSFASDSAFNYSFKTPGAKTFIHRIQGNDGCWDTTQRQVFVKPMPDPSFTGLQTFHCDDEDAFALTPVVAGGTFYGPNIVNQLYEPRLLWEDSVLYVVEVNGCTDSSEQFLEVYPFPKIELGNDTVLCKSEFLLLDVSFWASEYQWQDKRKDPVYRIVAPGTYVASVSNVCGTASDSIVVSYLDDLCRIYVPSAFTPNGDVHHQRYKPVFFDLDKMDYIIYTRWGEIIYQGNINDQGWDGTYQGVPVADGVFLVKVRYEYRLHGQKQSGTLSSTVTLIR